MPHCILFARCHARDASPATLLNTICAGQHSLDVAALADGHNNFLMRNQVLAANRAKLVLVDLRAALVTVLFLDLFCLLADSGCDARRIGEN